jgi:hypothetical protein
MRSKYSGYADHSVSIEILESPLSSVFAFLDFMSNLAKPSDADTGVSSNAAWIFSAVF